MKRRPIHERVKAHVEDSGMDLDEIAAATRWDRQRVYRLLAGKTKFRAEDMETLAGVLGKPVASLYRDKASAA